MLYFLSDDLKKVSKSFEMYFSQISMISFFYLSPATSIPKHNPSIITNSIQCLTAKAGFYLSKLKLIWMNSIMFKISLILKAFLYKAKNFWERVKLMNPIILKMHVEIDFIILESLTIVYSLSKAVSSIIKYKSTL
jgi:hypothetical protein